MANSRMAGEGLGIALGASEEEAEALNLAHLAGKLGMKAAGDQASVTLDAADNTITFINDGLPYRNILLGGRSGGSIMSEQSSHHDAMPLNSAGKGARRSAPMGEAEIKEVQQEIRKAEERNSTNYLIPSAAQQQQYRPAPQQQQYRPAPRRQGPIDYSGYGG